MAIDFDALRKKLGQLSGTNSRRNTMWRPQEGEESVVRLIAFTGNEDGLPFSERWFYYNIGNNPGLLAPYQFGNPDPIQELITKLRDEGTKESYELAKKLYPKARYYAPVVVRGEEEKGVRLFEFSKTIYMELLSIADDEDYGDFTDINQGFDFVVNASKVQDRPGFALSLRPKPKQTPLSSDASQITTWLENQPILLEERYKYTYDKLKEELQTFISGGEEKEDTIVSEPAVAFESETPAKEEKKFTLSTQGTPKKVKSEEFDSLFEDDLPF